MGMSAVGKSAAAAVGRKRQAEKDRWLRRIWGYAWRHKRKVLVASGASMAIAAISLLVVQVAWLRGAGGGRLTGLPAPLLLVLRGGEDGPHTLELVAALDRH